MTILKFSRIIAFFFFVLSFHALSGQSLSSQDWQEDLLFLQETIHADYPFLFKKINSEDFDKEVTKVHEKIPQMEEHEIVAHMARIVALFGYGHTSIPLSGWHPREKHQTTQMAVHLKKFKDGIFVQGTTIENKKALGAKVLKIEGKNIDEVMAAVKPFFPAENDWFFYSYGMPFLTNAEILHSAGVTPSLKSEIVVTLKQKEGKSFNHVFKPISELGFPGAYTYVKESGNWLDARDNSTDPLYLKNLDRISYMEHLPEHNAVYVRQSQILHDPNESIHDFFARVYQFIEENKVDKMILDVRLNGGGNNYNNKPIVTGAIKSRIDEPGRFFVLTGGQTYSACQNLVNELSNYTNAVFIGTPTGENINFYGDNNRVELPNSGIPVRLSFAWWQDKPQWENKDALFPHLNVEMTFEEYINNQDPLLDQALNFGDDNFILNPKQYLTDLYLTGQMEMFQKEAQRIAHGELYRFFDFEGEFNRVGYQLIGRGNTGEALQVFKMITAYFPDSANAWDSLAEGYWRHGDKESAIKYYKKAIEMDAEGAVGENARKMLREIELEMKNEE